MVRMTVILYTSGVGVSRSSILQQLADSKVNMPRKHNILVNFDPKCDLYIRNGIPGTLMAQGRWPALGVSSLPPLCGTPTSLAVTHQCHTRGALQESCTTPPNATQSAARKCRLLLTDRQVQGRGIMRVWSGPG